MDAGHRYQNDKRFSAAANKSKYGIVDVEAEMKGEKLSPKVKCTD